MSHKQRKETIRAYLSQPKVQAELRKKLLLAKESMATPISQVLGIVGRMLHVHIKETDLRQWGKKGWLDPQRKSTVGYRYYSIREIARIFIIMTLESEQYSDDEIKAFMDREHEFISRLIDEIAPLSPRGHMPDMLKRVDEAEKALFWRMFIEKTLYLATCLLFERPISGNIGIILPLHPLEVQAASADIRDIEGLDILGESLHGRCISPHATSTFITTKPTFDPPKNYRLHQPDWLLDSDCAPVAVYIVSDKNLEQPLKRASDEARRASGKLLKLLQDTASQWKEYLYWDGTFMAYIPDLRDTLPVGAYAWDKMAELIIQLGGMNKTRQQPNWSFCCILLQDIKQRFHPLIVQGQSQQSPYSVGETKLYLDKGSLSVRAFHSGHMTYLPNVAEAERDFARREEEPGTRSAIAIPIEGRRPPGAIYIASEEVDAFARKDDLIALRIMERIIAEQVMIYLGRTHLMEKFSEIITRPHVVEKSFSEFLSDYEFTTELEELLKQIQPKAEQAQNGETGEETTLQPFRNLTIISVGITGYEARSEAQTKSLLKAIGQCIEEWIDVHIEPDNAKLYCIYGERFYILLKNVNSDRARNYARRLHTRLREYIQRDKQIAKLLDDISPAAIHLHIGVVGHSYEALQETLANKADVATLRGTLTLRLDDALILGGEAEEDSIFMWHPQKGDFIRASVSSDQATADPPLTKELVRQIIEEEFLQQIIEEVHNRQEEWDNGQG